MYCMKCGTEIEDDSMFCRNCGANIQQGIKPDKSQSMELSTGIEKNIEKIIGMTGCLMMLLSGYMDFISVSYFTKYNYRLCEKTGDWKILTWLIIISMVFVFIDAGAFLGSLVTLATVAFSVFEFTLFDEAIQGSDIASSMISHEAGYYFLMIGTVVLIIGHVAHVGKMIREGKQIFLVAAIIDSLFR